MAEAEYTITEWNKDKMMLAILISKGEHTKAHKFVHTVFLAANSPLIQHQASGMLFVLDILMNRGREKERTR